MAHNFKLFPELTNTQMQFYYFESPHRQITENFSAKVVEVHDGDTVKVMWRERNFEFRVRLSFIQAPELDEVGGTESRDWLKDRIEGQEVEIQVDPFNRVGKWGRLIGDIIFGGESMSEAQMRDGRARNINEVVFDVA